MIRMSFFIRLFILTSSFLNVAIANDDHSQSELRFIQVNASTKESRTLAVRLGMNIESVRTDSIWGFADGKTIGEIRAEGLTILGNFSFQTGISGREFSAFPGNDKKYHDYAGVRSELMRMETDNPNFAKVHVIGQSLEGRDILALQMNTSPNDLATGESFKPGATYLGGHHAREHLSVEIPLILADYLLKNKTDPEISGLLSSRDIWIIPLVNPDGSEFDISGTQYAGWRKNRRHNSDGSYGVDLNRNYGYLWGSEGAGVDPNAETFRGTAAFSEPETQAIKTLFDHHANIKTLISYHTFSEEILYPWSGSFETLTDKKDLAVFVKMAQTMAAWSGYSPMQSSANYVASGDTCDWAYAAHGIFAFTFELSPKEITQGAGGGFYPGDAWINPTFAANLKPALYLLDLANDPYRALTEKEETADFSGQSLGRPLRNSAASRFTVAPF